MKKALLILVVTIMALAIPQSVKALEFSYTYQGQTLFYTTFSGNNHVWVSSRYYSEPTGNLEIPSSVTYNGNTYSVTSIGNYVFKNCSTLTSVTIPNSITEIGKQAFYGCNGLTLVTIPNSVRIIRDGAFNNCSGLTSVTFNADSCTSAGSCFYNCTNITNFTFGDNVKVIPDNLCYGLSGLTSITIPNSVKSIGASAFSNCSGLTSVTFNADSCTSAGSCFYYCTNITNFTFGDNVRVIPSYLCSGLSGLTSVTIPNSVISIGADAFRNCSGLNSISVGGGNMVYDSRENCNAIIETYTNTLLQGCKNTVIPNSVTSISNYAFYGCIGLTSMIIPNSVTSIGDWAFSRCSDLTFVTIGNSVTNIGEWAFDYCIGLTSVTIPNSVTSIGNTAFEDCIGLTSVTFNADSCTSAGSSNYRTFFGCTNITNFTFGDNVKVIPSYLCYEMSGLTSVTIPNSVTSIGNSAFSNCSGLTSVIFNADSCTLTGYLFDNTIAFYGCTNITNFTFGDNVRVIPSYLCSGLSGLTSVTIPNSVTSIDGYAFSNCSGLTSVIFNADSCISGSGYGEVFSGCTNITNFTFGDNVKVIPSSLCSGLSGLTSVTIPNSVKSIRGWAFSNCSGLTSVTIPDSVTSIGSYAFQYCSGLTTVNFNATNCTTMGSYNYPVFDGCTSLATLNIGEDVTQIPDYAFYGCSGLTSVTIPNSVTSIGDDAFRNCSGLTGSLAIPNSVTSIGQSAFFGCSGLTSVTIPNSVTSIGSYAFSGCSGLTSVTIPNSVTSIGNYAFANCSGLTLVTFNADSCTSAGSCFYNCTNITNFTFGDNVRVIPSYLCSGQSGLTSVTIPNSVTSIDGYAFYNCSGLTTVNFNATNCTTMGSSYYPVFSGCTNLAMLNIGDNVTSIPEYAFKNCSGLTSITIPNSVTSIGTEAFNGCSGLTSVNYNGTIADWCGIDFNNYLSNPTNYSHSLSINGSPLTNLVIPAGVIEIKQYAFNGCSGLTSVTIPNSVTSIGSYAFSGCSGLTEIISLALSAPSSSSAFGGVSHTIPVYIPCGSLPSYQTSWINFSNFILPPPPYSVYVDVANSTFGVSSITDGPNCDSTAVIAATANHGYHFTQWNDGNTQTPRTITLTQDTSFTAYFAPNQYTLSVVGNDGSLGSVAGGGTYNYLDTVEISATANDHYHFVQWNDGNRVNPRRVVITGNLSYTAFFAIDTHSVSVVVEDFTRGSVTGGGEYIYGTPCILTALAYEGYTFARWSNGVTSNPYAFAVICDVELTAIFVERGDVLYTVTVVSADPTMGSVRGGGQALSGGTVTIRAAGNPGYHFERWNDNNTDSVRTVEVHGNATYTAYFAANVGIDDVATSEFRVYSCDGEIVLEGTEGQAVSVYDIMGRRVFSMAAAHGPCCVTVMQRGVYLVKVGTLPARKVVVVR